MRGWHLHASPSMLIGKSQRANQFPMNGTAVWCCASPAHSAQYSHSNNSASQSAAGVFRLLMVFPLSEFQAVGVRGLGCCFEQRAAIGAAMFAPQITVVLMAHVLEAQ